MRLPRLSLPIRILIAIALGIAIGLIAPLWAVGLTATFNALFSQFLGFLIPLLIIGFVAPAIADVGLKAGKMLLVTAAIAYGATFCAGMAAFFTGEALFPAMLSGVNEGVRIAGGGVQPWFTVTMPPVCSVMTALVLSFLVGLGVAVTNATVLRTGLSELRDIITRAINVVIIPLLPLYIFGIFLDMTYTGEVATVLLSFARVIGVIFVMALVVLLVQYLIAGLVTRRNPFRLLWTMLPAYVTALGTASSAATIPVTLRQAIKMGVTEDTAGFVIPLCATIHMSGSTLKIVMTALALMMMHGMDYSTAMFAGFVAMLGITIIAAPGVPGGAIMASLGLLGSMLGFSDADNALMISLYIAMDSFGTACNVTGDGFIALVVDRIFGRRQSSSSV